MNFEKILVGIAGVSAIVLVFTLLEHISIRLFGDATVLGIYVAITMGVGALVALIGDAAIDWIKLKRGNRDEIDDSDEWK